MPPNMQTATGFDQEDGYSKIAKQITTAKPSEGPSTTEHHDETNNAPPASPSPTDSQEDECSGDDDPCPETMLSAPDDRAHKFRILTSMQTTYRVCLDSWKTGPGEGYIHSLTLIPDYGRFWGRFQIGDFSGIMLIDPVPVSEYEGWSDDRRPPPSYSFLWRGTSTQMPRVILNSKFTTGEIQFCEDTVTGHFDSMTGIDNPSQFSGEDRRAADHTGESVQGFIDEWNQYAFFPQHDEVIRLSPGLGDFTLAGFEVPTPPSPEPEWTSDSQNDFLKLVTGRYNAKSKAIRDHFPESNCNLSVCFHVDKERNTVWGRFHMGACDGFILFTVSASSVRHDTELRFRWRGKESGTKADLKGSGHVRITKAHAIRGVFHDMFGDVDFQGSRKRRPAENGGSGYEASYYRARWRESY